ncbi:hypothetical protein LZ31DRAFT_277085 [Colletotrichum somersetense]|nr:hypothetical protein LZ31DRAFT_277085 [Colletotrichum somersetense]
MDVLNAPTSPVSQSYRPALGNETGLLFTIRHSSTTQAVDPPVRVNEKNVFDQTLFFLYPIRLARSVSHKTLTLTLSLSLSHSLSSLLPFSPPAWREATECASSLVTSPTGGQVIQSPKSTRIEGRRSRRAGLKKEKKKRQEASKQKGRLPSSPITQTRCTAAQGRNEHKLLLLRLRQREYQANALISLPNQPPPPLPPSIQSLLAHTHTTVISGCCRQVAAHAPLSLLLW